MAKFKNKIAYLLALIAPVSLIADDEPASAGSDSDARSESSGSLSAGAIAAAVAAAPTN